MKAIGGVGRIVRLKTDSVVVENGVEVECHPGIGNYRVESLLLNLKYPNRLKMGTNLNIIN